MSDKAKTAREIEDVLASIRRLVSESHVAAPQDPVVPAQDAHIAPSVPAPQRLVLTPSLRVADPDDPWAPVPAPGAVVPADATTTEEEDPSWGLGDRLSDWGKIEDSAEKAVADATAEQAVHSEASPRADRLADLDQDAEDDLPDDFAASPPIVAEFEPETGDADWPDRGAGRALRDLALVRGKGWYAAAADMATSADALPTSAEVAEPGTDASTDPAKPETTTVSKAGRSMSDDQIAQAADDTARQGFTPVFSRRIDVRRPVGEDMSASRGEGQRRVETGADDVHVEDLGEMRQPFTFPETEDGLLDEETLRDIIAEVVREELQGVLGQRITRNVRKMVRREIRLALAAEDFE